MSAFQGNSRPAPPPAKPAVKSASVSSVQTVSERFDSSRDRSLQDREKELREGMEALEADTDELQKFADELEMEKAALEEQKTKVKNRETEIEAKAVVLQNALQAVEEFQKKSGGGGEGAKQLDHLLSANRNLQAVLEEEKNRIRKTIEHEMADQLGRIHQLEDELKTAYAQIEAGEQPQPVSDVDIQKILSDVTAQLNSQLGAGMSGSMDDQRILTRIDTLDKILAGGIPSGNVVLMNGPAGSMKTSLTYNIMHNLASKDSMKGMYLSLEQDRDSLIRQMERLGMSRKASVDNLMIVDLVDLRKNMEGKEGNWRSIIMQYVEHVMQETPFKMLALDSLESFMALTQQEYSRVEVQELFDWFRDLGLTTFVVSETPMAKLEGDEHMELYVADGAIELTMKEFSDSRVQRWLRCVKMRGANIDSRYHTVMVAGGTFILSIPMMRASQS
jgi:KaiC/GvpD/RAD55 family RecA-like ATPase/predicted  nucleic acid-binding Zn-ribbon protein